MSDEISATSIANKIAADIHSGVFAAGEMLPSERDLSESFSVGRNVIREAITILEGMGLLDQSKGKRPRVIEPTLANVMQSVAEAAKFFFSGSEGLAHLEQARLFLETSLLRYACAHATNAQIGKMVEAVEACEMARGDVADFREADVAFHRAIAEVPGNPIFTALHDTFVDRLMKNRAVLPDFAKTNVTSNQEHREIVSAILDKDAERAVEVLTRHLTRNYGTYFRLAMDRQSPAGAYSDATSEKGEIA